MKKIKLLFLILLLILITGCKQEYNLEISDSAINEQFKIIINNNEDNLKKLNANYYPLHANNDIVYDKKISKNKNNVIAVFNYKYKPYDFVNANTINQCFTNRKVIVDDEKFYEIELSNLNDCMYDYNLDVNIITKNKVVSNNADKVKGNKYTWHLTEDNKDTFSIQIKIEKGTAKTISEKYGIVTYIVLGGIFFIIFIAVSIFVKKVKKNNKV